MLSKIKLFILIIMISFLGNNATAKYEKLAYDFDFNDLVGDPRDVYKDSYRGLEHTQRKYWKKYSKTNSFWDYFKKSC